MSETTTCTHKAIRLCQVPSGSRAAIVQLSKGSDKGSRSSSANPVVTANSTTSSKYSSSNHGFSPDQELDPEVVSDYENRIAFIQKQHEKLLAALHREVEQLKRKNKELQFQLVMRGFQTQLSLSHSDSSPALSSSSDSDLTSNGHQATTVQVLTGEEALKLEEVEANMKQLQDDLHQAKSRNIYLNDLVEEQKRKVEDLELRESAAKVVKATTTSFPLTPPFNGFMEDSGSSIRSYSSTLISTPIARSETMQIQEDEIQRLETENIKQRQELMELRHFIELNLRLKFKGCNHPTRRLLNRPQRQNTNPDFRLEPLESATSSTKSNSKQTLNSKERSLGSSLERRQVQRNKVVNFRDNRSSSMTQLPTIRNSRNNTVREHRQSFHAGLPPVLPQSRGSERSEKQILPPNPRTAPPLNLVSMKKENEVKKGLKSKMKLKQAVIMPKPMIYSKNSQVVTNATRISKKVKK